MKKPVVVHPFLVAIHPIFYYFSRDVGQIRAGRICMAVVTMAAIATLVWALLQAVLRNRARSGLVVSLLVVLFFSYGHVYKLTYMWSVFGIFIGRHRYLLPFWLLLAGLGAVYAFWTRRTFENLTKCLNVMAACLVLMSAFSVGHLSIKAKVTVDDDVTTAIAQASEARPSDVASLPDIYYIIHDAYGRDDVFREIYGYDNTPFLKSLEERGFYIARKGMSNYAQTALSLSSSLNMCYHDRLAERMGPHTEDRTPLANIMAKNRVARLLRQHGYLIAYLVSRYSIVRANNPDVFLTPSEWCIRTPWWLDEFGDGILNPTVIAAVHRLLSRHGDETHRRLLSFQFDTLEKLPVSGLPGFPERERPMFVFAHTLVAHPPYVFLRDGTPNDHECTFEMHHMPFKGKVKDDYQRLLIEQLIYSNKRTLAFIDSILANSTRPAVIIIQGDHGPRSSIDYYNPTDLGLKERLCILNAYHLPNGGNQRLHERITPVNTFRVVLNHYLGTNLKLLRDASYFSDFRHPYGLKDVTRVGDLDLGTLAAGKVVAQGRDRRLYPPRGGRASLTR